MLAHEHRLNTLTKMLTTRLAKLRDPVKPAGHRLYHSPRLAGQSLARTMEADSFLRRPAQLLGAGSRLLGRPARRTRGDQNPRHPRRRRRGRVRRGRAGAEAGPRPRFSGAWPPGPAARALAASAEPDTVAESSTPRQRLMPGRRPDQFPQFALVLHDQHRCRHRRDLPFRYVRCRAARAGSPMIPAPARLRTSSPGPRCGAGARLHPVTMTPSPRGHGHWVHWQGKQGS